MQMQTLAERRRAGREAQARYAARLRESGVPSRLQVLTAIEAGARRLVVEMLAMEDGAVKDACVRLVADMLRTANAHMDAQPDLNLQACREAVTRSLLKPSAA